jgi:hypothetical protein
LVVWVFPGLAMLAPGVPDFDPVDLVDQIDWRFAMLRVMLVMLVMALVVPVMGQSVPVLSQTVGLTTGTLVVASGSAVSFQSQPGLVELRVMSNDPATTPALVSVKLTRLEPVGDFVTLEDPGQTGPMVEGGQSVRFRLWSRGWFTVRGVSGDARVAAWVVE